MSHRIARTVALIAWVATIASGAAFAQEDAAAYQEKLKAAREAVYAKYLHRPQIAPVTQTPPPTGAALDVMPVQRAAQPGDRQPVLASGPGTAYIFREHQTPYAFGDLRYNFYDNLNIRRSGRWGDFPLFPYIYQPTYDWRYRRSWPRPVQVREYVKSHWLWDGRRYHYVPGHSTYETRWVVQGWPRYRWNGSHYSVSISYRR